MKMADEDVSELPYIYIPLHTRISNGRMEMDNN